MNDYWNDPPEQPEPPECCDEIMDVDDKGVCVCQKCGKRIEPPADIDCAAFADVELPDNYLRESANSVIEPKKSGTIGKLSMIKWKKDGGDYQAKIGKILVLLSWQIKGRWCCSLFKRKVEIGCRIFPNIGLAKSWGIKRAKNYERGKLPTLTRCD